MPAGVTWSVRRSIWTAIVLMKLEINVNLRWPCSFTWGIAWKNWFMISDRFHVQVRDKTAILWKMENMLPYLYVIYARMPVQRGQKRRENVCGKNQWEKGTTWQCRTVALEQYFVCIFRLSFFVMRAVSAEKKRTMRKSSGLMRMIENIWFR